MNKLLSITTILVLFATNLFAQNLNLRSRLDYTPDLSDIWGWTDGEKEYAIVGLRNGVSFVDVTDPDNVEEVQFVYGNPCTWRDIKTWRNYAYVTQDCNSANAGLSIIDMSQLPDTVITYPWRTDGTVPVLRSAHNIYIDEFGYAYVVGHNFGNGGALILDLNSNPTNPTVAGQYTSSYVHDCYVENNILYTGEYNIGHFGIVDVSDKANITVLAKYPTPAGKSHNIWPSDDKNFVFTTDETTSINTSIAAFDVRDLNDIKLLDEFNSNPTAVPHNVHNFNDFLVASHYSYGVTILDVSQPDKMVEVAHYDTEPNSEGDNYNGCWGVYPYFPSGNIVASDQGKGLYVFTPEYKRAVHIRGTVFNAFTNNTIFDAKVRIDANDETNFTASDLAGKFKEGFPNSGDYTIRVSKDGYFDWQSTYTLNHGDLIDIDIQLIPLTEISDTIYTDVNINDSTTVCIDASFSIDTSYLSNGNTASMFGNWITDANGCLTYSANENSGNYVDSICIVVADDGNIETEASVVIVSVINDVTSSITNTFNDGTFTLLKNPVNDRLYIRSNLDKREILNLSIYNINGQNVFQQQNSAFNELFSIPVNNFEKGLYILSIQSQKGIGTIKFIVQ